MLTEVSYELCALLRENPTASACLYVSTFIQRTVCKQESPSDTVVDRVVP
jgi:hypothetical protein